MLQNVKFKNSLNISTYGKIECAYVWLSVNKRIKYLRTFNHNFMITKGEIYYAYV